MNPTDTSFNRPPTNSPGAKTQEPAKKALEFGREVKGQATELAKTATETVKTQAANLTESAKDVASDAGARHWAIAASLIASAKLNGVNPQAWLTDVLERMVSGRIKSHALDTMLPWTWKAEQLPATAHA